MDPDKRIRDDSDELSEEALDQVVGGLSSTTSHSAALINPP